MTDTNPDLKPNERKVLDSLLALGEATAAKVGEHAGLAYPTTTPKLRKLETLGLAEKFRNDASQMLWRATSNAAASTTAAASSDAAASTNAAASSDDGTHEAAQAPAPATDEPGHSGESGTAEADGAAPDESAPTAPDLGEMVPQAPATPAAAGAAGQPEAVEPEESGDDAPAGEDATAPADAPAPKAKRKRPAGALGASVLAILQGDPGGKYKVNDLRKLVNKADEATGYPAASAGAIANALDKLTGKGQVASVPAKHATFQAAPVG